MYQRLHTGALRLDQARRKGLAEKSSNAGVVGRIRIDQAALEMILKGFEFFPHILGKLVEKFAHPADIGKVFGITQNSRNVSVSCEQPVAPLRAPVHRIVTAKMFIHRIGIAVKILRTQVRLDDGFEWIHAGCPCRTSAQASRHERFRLVRIAADDSPGWGLISKPTAGLLSIDGFSLR